MKLFSILFLAASFALVACGDDSSSSSAPPNENGSDSPSKPKYDCTVKGGVKVLYPAGGETFHLGDTITVVYGSDVQGSGYRLRMSDQKTQVVKHLQALNFKLQRLAVTGPKRTGVESSTSSPESGAVRP